jgi:hypothetical protein
MIQTSNPFSPLAIWGFAQLCFLGIGVSGFPLWAHHPVPRESLAFPVLLCGQAVFACWVGPALGRDWRLVILGLLVMGPMDQLAGVLSHAPQFNLMKGLACNSLWLVGLMVLGRVLHHPRAMAAVGGLAILFLVGGAVIDYLRWEAAATYGISSIRLAISLLPQLYKSPENTSALLWIEASLPLLAAGLISVFSRYPKAISTSLHQQR